MKFSKLRFEKIGPFDNTALDFSEGNYGLHIIYGSNEAGKSSALRYIQWLLFGIPVQNSDNFKHKHPSFLIESTLTTKDKTNHTFFRRKKTKDPLVDEKGSDATAQLTRLIQGLTKDNFDLLFGINHAQLRSGGCQFLEGKVEIAKLIFEAGTGVSNLNKIIKSLQTRSEDIYKKNKNATSELNILLRTASVNLESLNSNKLNLKDYEMASANVIESEMQLTRADGVRETLIIGESNIKEILDALPELSRYKTAAQVLQELHNIPEISEVYNQKYEGAYIGHLSSSAILRNQAENVAGIQANLRSINPNQLILESQNEIEDLNKTLGVFTNHLSDIPKRQNEKAQAENQALQLIKDYFPQNSFDNITDLAIDQNTKTQIQENGEQITKLKTQIDGLETNILDKLAQIELQKKKNREFETHPKLAEIQSSLTSIKANKLTPQDIDLLFPNLQTQINKAEGKLKLLPHQALSKQEFLQIRLPSLSEVQKFFKLFSDHEIQKSNLLTSVQGKNGALGSKQKSLEELQKNSNNLSIETLKKMRIFRNLAWDQVENILSGKVGIIPEEIKSAFDKATNPREAFLLLSLQVDHYTDQLLAVADQVGQANQLTADCLGLQKELEELKNQHKQNLEIQSKLNSDWQNLWANCKITSPGSPKEMQDWLIKADTLQNELIELDASEKSFNIKKLEQLPAFNNLISITCSNLGDFATALLKAEEVLKLESTKKAKKDLNIEQYEQYDSEYKSIQKNLINKKEQLNKIMELWSKLMLGLNLKNDSSSSNANAHLDALTKIQSYLKTRLETSDRISKMEELNKGIQKRVSTVLDKISLPILATEHSQIPITIATLATKLAAENKEVNRKNQFKEDLEKAEVKLNESKKAAQENEEILTPLAKLLGNISVDQITREHFNSISKKMQNLKALADSKNKLVEKAAGKNFDFFIEELEKVNPSVLKAELERIKTESEELQKIRDALIANRESTQIILKSFKDKSGANDLSSEREFLKIQCLEKTKEFAQLILAKIVLEKTIENYRNNNENPILKKACSYLKTLTNGAFTSFEPDEDSEGKFLALKKTDESFLNFRATNLNFNTGASYLSDGTADQLFLALRLAGIETNLDKLEEPMPVILDDILVNFDDDRALSTLRCLAEFSNKTQVILFTHHQHLQKLVSASNFADKVFMHKMG